MLKIRLKLIGKKSQPYYLIALMNSNTKRNGKVINCLGFYNPLINQIDLKFCEIKKKIKIGVQVSLIVKKILLKFLLKKEIIEI
jgi:small subunit ribosomal protein S16